MSDDLACRSYTRARRLPQVIGHIGRTPIAPKTPAQLIVGLGSFLVLVWTRRAWGLVVPGGLRLVVLAGVPLALGWLVRHARFEGRSPARASRAWAGYALRSRSGVVRGRAWRRPRPTRCTTRAFVEG